MNANKHPHTIEIGYDPNAPDFVVHPHLQAYLLCKIGTHFIEGQPPEFGPYIRECSEFITNNPSEELLQRIDVDAEAVLELGIRYLSGCDAPDALAEGALWLWDMILHPSSTPIPNTSLLTIQRALSCAAHAYLNKYLRILDQAEAIRYLEGFFGRSRGVELQPSEYLLVAAQYANASAALGFVSPAVTNIGRWVESVAEKSGRDMRNDPRYRTLTHFWRAYEARMKELDAKERKRQLKRANAPNAYQCAAEGCPIEAATKAALGRCAGPCPAELKAHYCSKACQRKDWARHKYICKSKPSSETIAASETHLDAIASSLTKLVADYDTAEGGGDSVESKDDDMQITSEKEGPGCLVDIPCGSVSGGKLTIQSKNLSIECLRMIKDQIGDSWAKGIPRPKGMEIAQDSVVSAARTAGRGGTRRMNMEDSGLTTFTSCFH